MNPLKTGNFTCMHKQCVPGLSLLGGGGGGGRLGMRLHELMMNLQHVFIIVKIMYITSVFAVMEQSGLPSSGEMIPELDSSPTFHRKRVVTKQSTTSAQDDFSLDVKEETL